MSRVGFERGRRAEQAAAEYLSGRGWSIMAANERTPAGELDLVCLDGDTVVIVEVKARSNDLYGAAIESIGPRKQRRLMAAAAWWLAKGSTSRLVRFDVVVVCLDSSGDLRSLAHMSDVVRSAA